MHVGPRSSSLKILICSPSLELASSMSVSLSSRMSILSAANLSNQAVICGHKNVPAFWTSILTVTRSHSAMHPAACCSVLPFVWTLASRACVCADRRTESEEAGPRDKRRQGKGGAHAHRSCCASMAPALQQYACSGARSQLKTPTLQDDKKPAQPRGFKRESH